MVFSCNKCVKVFSTRSELHQHHEVDHGRVNLADVQGEKYPCLRCHREFLTQSIFVSHSRDHKENIYACNECLWHINTIAGLIKHCQDTHDDRNFACTTCWEVFASNPDLCRHTTSYHIKLCHICHRTFVSDDKLIDHVREIHLGATVCTREEIIEDEQAQVHAARQLFRELQRRERRKKRKRKRSTGMMMMMTMMRMMMTHITRPKTTMMTARLTPSSGPPEGSSGKLMRRVTRK